MRSEKDIIAEIKRTDETIKSIVNVARKETKTLETEEYRKGIDLLMSYRSGLEFSINGTARRRQLGVFAES